MTDSSKQEKKKASQGQVDEQVISLYAAKEKVYARETDGFWSKLRNNGLVVLLAIFFALPWVNWTGRQAILFDMPNRRFYIFDLVIWPQDLIILSLFLLIMAYTLFFVTALFGRLWCGYACPQTIWTESYVWIERFVEGSRAKQMKLDRMPWNNPEKLRKKAIKHFLWVAFSLWTGLTFVGYFTPIRQLFPDFFALNASLAASFWSVMYGALCYVLAGIMREQVCKTMCPYARFQGAMYDKNTMLVTYDDNRGEPRRKARRGENQDGHCIDCNMCVQVCPTGIDIRDGIQYECINCALCIDACDDVMDKIDAPRGLIRHTSSNDLKGAKAKFFRPKTIGYGIGLVLGLSVLFYKVATIAPIDLNLKRDRNILARYASGGRIENIYDVNVLNKTLTDATFRLSISGLKTGEIKGPLEKEFTVKSGKVFDGTVRILADKKELKAYNTPIVISVENVATGDKSSSETRFLNIRKR